MDGGVKGYLELCETYHHLSMSVNESPPQWLQIRSGGPMAAPYATIAQTRTPLITTGTIREGNTATTSENTHCKDTQKCPRSAVIAGSIAGSFGR